MTTNRATSPWNHAICDDCWLERHPARTPFRFVDESQEIEMCCFCGADTQGGGIYVRHDPRDPQLVCGPPKDEDVPW